jgi:hypothetical protein
VRLTTIRPGDVVLVDDGLPFYALVKDKQPARLRVQPICGHFNPRPVKASDVKVHWRRAK